MTSPDGPAVAAAGAAPVLTARGLRAQRGRRTVLHDIDLSVHPGEIVALLGPNGAGKSTLVTALGGMLPTSGGTVERTGRSATVLQSPSLARRSVAANVELAMAWAGTPRLSRRRQARDAMALMRVDHLARRPAHTLSGGEQRRVHLARAVAIAPDILFLDEPFDGLDPHTHVVLRDDVTQVLRGVGGAVVIVLHDRRDAWAIADRVVVLIDGALAASGTTEQVLDAPPSIEVARFVGFDGELRTGRSVLLTRAVHVRPDPDGDRRGTVVARQLSEEGARLRLRTEHGEVWALSSSFAVREGDELRFRIEGGVEFAADDAG